jgi:hypothetical protein
MLRAEMIRTARASMPDLEFNQIQFVNSGWDNDILIING